ncbi:glycosyltransferase [Streptomyces nogalater]
MRWYGFLPNDRALARLSGALAGLSLLHDQPNYRHSRPTKVVEYMAHGVPVVTTPTPLAAELVERHGCGLVVPYRDPRRRRPRYGGWPGTPGYGCAPPGRAGQPPCPS